MIRQLLGLEERAIPSETFNIGPAFVTARTASGKPVTIDTALQVSAVYGSWRIISDNVSTLPVGPFIESGTASEPFDPVPEWLLFESGPHGRIEVLSQVVISLLSDGNAYLATYRDPTGRILWIEVLDPTQIEPVRMSDGSVGYEVNGGEILTSFDVQHIAGMMKPGTLKGVSPIRAAQETIGLSLASTEYGAAFFGNGAIPGMTVEVPGELSDAGVARLKSAWNEAHQGSGNARKLAVLTEGAKFSAISIPPEDAQFLETRAFQVADIARIYGVPPHLLADATGSTSWGSGLAEQNTAFVQQSLRPWVVRIEAAFTAMLRSEGYPRTVSVRLNVDGLLRGDYQKRVDTYVKGIGAGLYTINECRGWEGLPPVEGGDEILVPSYQQTAGATQANAELVKQEADAPPTNGDEE